MDDDVLIISSKSDHKRIDYGDEGSIYLIDDNTILKYLIKLDKAIVRNHDREILHGDFTNNNFLVDQDYNPVIVDTDSFAIGEYNLNPKIMVLKYYKRIFGRNCSKLDNEIFTSSLMMMQCFINGEQIKFGDSEEYFKKVVDIFSFEKETKEIQMLYSQTQEINHTLVRH